ncbi:cytochrome C [Novosphingobium humi]|uniref:Cytochrome C n=1 Tax=Novosphingobium humi TaxID=2282397 RepID=A0ABY7TXL6_9SPHN|nr:cytochrome C [Novosphingobium humi]WCT78003.1 cytochrome C [Novosphingobium humi]WJS98488.1 cytochrome C [Novosphingobium humi]
MKTARWIGAGALLALPWLAASVAAQADPVRGISDPELARSDFIEHCGGCHGPDGRSAPAALPELRGRVGWLMCTPASRAYLIRLPNIAHSRISDNAELADMLNYMVFVVGGDSAPVGTRPFTAEEVTRERAHPLVSGSLTAERARHVGEAIRQCHAPVSLRLNYPGEKKG